MLDEREALDEPIPEHELPRAFNRQSLGKRSAIVAAGPSVQNVSLTGAVPVGIVGDAGRWVKTAQ